MSGNNGILEKMAERVNGLPTGRLVEAYESLEESALLFERADRILARLGAGDRLALESAFRRMNRFGGDGMTPREAGRRHGAIAQLGKKRRTGRRTGR